MKHSIALFIGACLFALADRFAAVVQSAQDIPE
jgi:hypothetical protein